MNIESLKKIITEKNSRLSFLRNQDIKNVKLETKSIKELTPISSSNVLEF